MARQREVFVKGCAKVNNIPAAKANQIFDLLEKFAGYGFNKSHAAAYAVVAYQTAWLKANYPVEFLSAMMTNDMGDTAKLGILIGEARQLRHRSAAAGLSTRAASFHAQRGRAAGGGRGDSIRPGRDQGRRAGGGGEHPGGAGRDGKFSSLAESVRAGGRAHGQPQSVWRRLIKSGACDGFGETRATMFGKMDRVLTRAAGIIQDRQRGQNTLFGHAGGARPTGGPRRSSRCPNGRSTNCWRTRRSCSASMSPAIR